jgi:hypothetical protein
MTFPIPSGITPIPLGDVRRTTEIEAPSVPVGISGVGAIDPRQALRMPEPVVTADQSSFARQSLERNFQESPINTSSVPTEPKVSQAALLEISQLAPDLIATEMTNLAYTGTNISGSYANSQLLTQLNNLSSEGDQNTSSLDMSSSKINSEITSTQMNTLNRLIAEVMDQSQSPSGVNPPVPTTQINNLTVSWPKMDTNTQSQLMQEALQANDPKSVFAALKNDLKNSGIFASEQLAHALMPSIEESSSINSPMLTQTSSSLANVSSFSPQQLMQQLDPSSSALVDAIRLALRGNLYWQGDLASNLPATMQREDAWETNPQDPSQVIKGTRISVEVVLPKLGSFTVIGTQFNDQIYLTMKAANSNIQNTFQQQYDQLQQQLVEQGATLSSLQWIKV